MRERPADAGGAAATPPPGMRAYALADAEQLSTILEQVTGTLTNDSLAPPAPEHQERPLAPGKRNARG